MNRIVKNVSSIGVVKSGSILLSSVNAPQNVDLHYGAFGNGAPVHEAGEADKEPDAPAFPVDCLPGILKARVLASVEGERTPAAIAACCVLVLNCID